MYKIAKENLPALFHRIAAKNELYLPVRQNGQVNYAAWSEDAVPELDTLKTVKSPKDAFFPQSETLYTCVKDEKNLHIEPEELKQQEFVLFGVKACDLQGIHVLDQVFLADPPIPFMRRAGNTVRSWRWPAMNRKRPAFAAYSVSTAPIRKRMCPHGS